MCDYCTRLNSNKYNSIVVGTYSFPRTGRRKNGVHLEREWTQLSEHVQKCKLSRMQINSSNKTCAKSETSSDFSSSNEKVMYPKAIIEKVKELFERGDGVRQIAHSMAIPVSSVHKLVHNDYNKSKKMRGPKPKLNRRQKTRIKKEVRRLCAQNECVTSRKIKDNCELTVSTRTVRRALKEQGFSYQRVKQQLPLTRQHKDNRLAKATEWLRSKHPFDKTIFTDEKKFSLDGPDNLSTYMDGHAQISRIKRQAGGGSVMVCPDGFVHVEKLHGRVKALDYLDMLKNHVKPILYQRFPDGDYYLQQDNAPIHTAKVVSQWFQEVSMKVLDWPAKSPDLNITENVWQMISQEVYDNEQFHSQAALWGKIQKVVVSLNENKKHVISKMFQTYHHRLLEVIQKRGGETKY